jgi:hypothetical protein
MWIGRSDVDLTDVGLNGQVVVTGVATSWRRRADNCNGVWRVDQATARNNRLTNINLFMASSTARDVAAP